MWWAAVTIQINKSYHNRDVHKFSWENYSAREIILSPHWEMLSLYTRSLFLVLSISTFSKLHKKERSDVKKVEKHINSWNIQAHFMILFTHKNVLGTILPLMFYSSVGVGCSNRWIIIPMVEQIVFHSLNVQCMHFLFGEAKKAARNGEHFLLSLLFRLYNRVASLSLPPGSLKSQLRPMAKAIRSNNFTTKENSIITLARDYHHSFY